MKSGTVAGDHARKHCLIVYDEPTVSEQDQILAAELARRGYAVRVVVLDRTHGPATVRPWASRARALFETLAFRGAPKLRVESLAADVVHVRAVEELIELARSLRPRFVFHFGAPDAAAQLMAGTGCDVYQVWIDGSAETLRMNTLFGTPRRAAWELAVTRGARIVLRADVVPIHSWALLDRKAAASRAVVLLLRAIELGPGGGEVEVRSPTSPLQTLRETVRVAGSALLRGVMKRWMRADLWFLAYRTHTGEDFRFLFGGPERFYADPCAVRHGDDHYVFLESYEYRLERGVISVSRLQPDGTLGLPSVVLQRPYHISYPFVFECGDQWFMVPETSENRSVELYRAIDFPFSWRLETTLLSGIAAVDATLHYVDSRWWMFLSDGEHGSSASDELSIYIADQLTGPWRAHARNPVKRTARSARPAGRLFMHGGQLIRPAQDCSRVFGGGIHFCVVEVLTETEFVEHEREFLAPSTIPGAEALHTWSATGGLEVLDARFPLAWTTEPRFLRQLERNRRLACATTDTPSPRRPARHPGPS